MLLLGGGGAVDAQPTDASSTADTTGTPVASVQASYAPEAGRLPHRYIGPETHGGHKQNWDAAQDSSGLLHVANTEGILTYDGREWRRTPTANRSIARSITADEEGRIFVGAQRDFGMLRRDSTGRLTHVSLLDHVPEAHRSFTDVWRTEVAQDGVYFVSGRRLFRWHPDRETMESWAPPEDEFGMAGVARDTLFVREYARGLMAVQDDSLTVVSGGEAFVDRDVIFVRPHPQHGVVVGTYSGLFVRDGAEFRRLETDIDDVLDEAWTQRGRVLSDGSIAIATIDFGVLLLGPDGSFRRRLSARDQPVLGVHEDPEGGLWAMLDGGLVRYDLGAPYTRYGEAEGLEGRVNDVVRHRDTLFAATNGDTYRLRPARDSAATFVGSTVNTQSWALLSVEDDLLIGTVRGLNVRRPNGTVRRLFDADHVYGLLRSRTDPSRIYAATGRGVRIVERTDEGWAVGDRIPNLDTEARALAEGPNGALWVGTSFDGVYRAQFVGGDSTVVDQFGTADGLPSDRVDPIRWRGRVVIGTSDGLMDFVPGADPPFVAIDSVEAPAPASSGGVVRPQLDARGRMWGVTGRGPGRWRQQDGTWAWAPGALRRLQGTSPNVLYLEKKGRVHWIGTQQGLVRYVPGAEGDPVSSPTLLREVEQLGADSLLTANAATHPVSPLPFAKKNIRIAYSSPTFATPENVEYQHRLEGQESEWSAWTPRTAREFPELGAGPHVFLVRARTAYGDTTRAARYSFTIYPPWYRTWWAYGLYGLLGLAFVGGAVQWRTRRLRRRQSALEEAVAERTEQLRQKNDQLATQAEKLKELDAAKDRFFANVSHEFRTPLTLIRGPVREVREALQRGDVDPQEQGEQLAIAERNTARLRRLIEQILGLARLDAGTYELDALPTDLGDAVSRIVRRFEPLAERHRLALTVEAKATTPGEEAEAHPVYVDPEALEHVMGNLLSNAIKFTPEGGDVAVTVHGHPDAVEVVVSDTGPGIPADQQATIFDRFQQVEEEKATDQEGTGIGLAFSQDLVELHGGTLTVESTEGEGTAFVVRLPRGRDALRSDQLADGSTGAALEDGASTAEFVSSSDVQSPSSAPPSASSTAGASFPDAASGAGEQSDPDQQREQSRIVLIVDDNADVRRYVRSVLEPEFTVLEAADGAEGGTVARNELPDVILADVMMPAVDGHEMTRRLKDDPDTATIPIIMVTARAETQDEVTGLRVGADDYVTKPFDANVLRQRVGGVLTLQERLRRRLRDELQAEEGSSEPDRGPVETRAREAVRDHLTDPDFGVSDLAEAMAMSRSTLYRKLKEEAGLTPSTLMREVRLAKARTLLRDGEPATQVAYAVGYTSLSSFSQTFKSEVGVTPSTYAANAS
jgi:signal transduction histidine kinase/DNA-binding response OmpR family regulator/ligand-binding sensor domain-containing protein